MTFVKICGITRDEDGKAALDAGASAIGFVFWPKSPRFIEPVRAKAIVAAMPRPCVSVGVFVNQPPEYVNAVAELVGLSAVQLHGDETPECVEGIDRPVIKALGTGNATGNDDESAWPMGTTLLVDAHDPEKRGGTGGRADWTRAAKLARTRRIVLAGGITPENVAEAVASVRPYGIDVSSGVESAPGVKDPVKLTALFEALRVVKP
jgi:phosphoribosylanthranilate isomerase